MYTWWHNIARGAKEGGALTHAASGAGDTTTIPPPSSPRSLCAVANDERAAGDPPPDRTASRLSSRRAGEGLPAARRRPGDSAASTAPAAAAAAASSACLTPHRHHPKRPQYQHIDSAMERVSEHARGGRRKPQLSSTARWAPDVVLSTSPLLGRRLARTLGFRLGSVGDKEAYSPIGNAVGPRGILSD